MQSTSTVDSPPAPPETSSRTWRKAFKDINDGLQQRQLWAHLGWQDIKQRYRRSVIGPLWITIGMGMTATALGLLYSQLFSQEIRTFLPYLTVGFIVWNFILGCLTEGTEVFIANEGLMKQLPSPISVHVLRLVWRQSLLFAHNMIVYLVVLAIFQMPISWTVIAAIPAFMLLMLNGGWVALVFGIIATRFRDIPPVINSLSTLLFFMTPIVWNADILKAKAPELGWRANLADLNPLYHYIEIIRDPLIGQDQLLYHWIVVLACTVVGWALALVVLRNYRARITYWV
ncbi:ABC-2 type transport system permease protein [Saccharopolyspora shandongensis]|uniref:ABC-2 type transport system permease protein n=1 Tax=Saccharopolyspora shandongensis TaxID=418495 RepID=A0A1H2RTL2_9PSEU|nr:ABC transporter permease [Saccharopolyspora shandongensis]SDW22520.1 ABC-2 type transport system permease protein [Saccharopolyspora shandongensis]